MGSSLFARRYWGNNESRVLSARTYAPTEHNSYCSLFLRVLRCFTSPGSLHASVTSRIPIQDWRVPPFGNLRIIGYKPPPRSLSQVSRVLLRRPRPRHPPRTLMSLVRRPEYHNHCAPRKTHIRAPRGFALTPRPLSSSGRGFNYLTCPTKLVAKRAT